MKSNFGTTPSCNSKAVSTADNVKRPPLKVFYSYAHQDESARDQLDQHLELLARRNLIQRWYDRHIVPGGEWNQAIDVALAEADIILLLVSRAFLASRFVRENEIPAAMQEHATGRARVVPILLEDVKGWQNQPFAKLELLPAKGRAVSLWRDPVDAYANVAKGIGRVAKDIIVAGGGPFEFGAHEFTAAELTRLKGVARKRCGEGLARLRARLDQAVPHRRYEKNLLVATWALRKFGSLKQDRHLSESLFFIAQAISAFDLVALQEVDRNAGMLETVLDILGPDWSHLITDVAPGKWGNNERFAIVYYRPRIEFRGFSSNLVLPPGETQLARPPLLAAFRTDDWEFKVCTTHILYGGGGKDAIEKRLIEIKGLTRYLRNRARYDQDDLLLLGDFQLENPGSAIHQALLENQVQIPEATLLPAHIRKDRYYSVVGYVAKREMPLTKSSSAAGMINVYEDVFREEDFESYARTAAYRYSTKGTQAGVSKQARLKRYERWKTYQLSDHLPLWVELDLPGTQ